jgi:hypothetical protein
MWKGKEKPSPLDRWYPKGEDQISAATDRVDERTLDPEEESDVEKKRENGQMVNRLNHAELVYLLNSSR